MRGCGVSSEDVVCARELWCVYDREKHVEMNIGQH